MTLRALVPAVVIALAACNDDDKTDDDSGADTDSDTPTDSDSGTPTDSDSATDTDSDTTDAGPYNVTLTGIGYAPHDGQTLYAVVIDESTGTPVGTDDQVMDAAGNLLLELTDVVAMGGDYKIVWYADVDGDLACEGPDVAEDHAWSLDIPSPTADVALNYDHDTNFDPKACVYWP